MAEKIELESVKEPEVNALVEEKKEPHFGWYDAIVMMVLFVLSQMVGGVLGMWFCKWVGFELPSAVMRESLDSEVIEIVSFMQSRLVAVGYFFAMVICLTLVGIYGRIKGWREMLSFRAPGWASPFRLLCGYLLMWCVSIAVEPLAEMLPGDQSSLGGGGWLLISAVLLAPLFEEVLFRGYIAGILRRAYGGVVAWFLSALLFGVAHMIPSVMVTAFFSGLVLSFFYLRYRSLVMVIMLHAMNNLTACFLKTIDMDELTFSQMLGGGVLYWSVYGVALAVVLIAFWRMWVAVGRIKSDNYQPKK